MISNCLTCYVVPCSVNFKIQARRKQLQIGGGGGGGGGAHIIFFDFFFFLNFFFGGGGGGIFVQIIGGGHGPPCPPPPYSYGPEIKWQAKTTGPKYR